MMMIIMIIIIIFIHVFNCVAAFTVARYSSNKIILHSNFLTSIYIFNVGRIMDETILLMEK